MIHWARPTTSAVFEIWKMKKQVIITAVTVGQPSESTSNLILCLAVFRLPKSTGLNLIQKLLPGHIIQLIWLGRTEDFVVHFAPLLSMVTGCQFNVMGYFYFTHYGISYPSKTGFLTRFRKKKNNNHKD